MECDSKGYLVRSIQQRIEHNFNTTLLTGTSIGFKNIASKIAYDLRLWLNRQTVPNNISANINCALSKNTQTSPTNEKQSVSSIDNEKQPDDVWSFDSGDDVIEISLGECETPAKTSQFAKK